MLYTDGEQIASESITVTDAGDGFETIIFEDLDYTIRADKKISFLVKAEVFGAGDDLDPGDTITASIHNDDGDEVDGIDAEDESGEDLAIGDKTGAAEAEAVTFYDVGFTFALISDSATITAGEAGIEDVGNFTIRFRLTAFGGDVQIDKSCEESDEALNDGGADAPDQGIRYTNVVDNVEGIATTCSFTSTAGDAADAGSFLVEEEDSKTFTLSVATTGDDDFVRVYLSSINWDDDAENDDAEPDLYFTAGLGDDKTQTASLNLREN